MRQAIFLLLFVLFSISIQSVVHSQSSTPIATATLTLASNMMLAGSGTTVYFNVQNPPNWGAATSCEGGEGSNPNPPSLYSYLELAPLGKCTDPIALKSAQNGGYCFENSDGQSGPEGYPAPPCLLDFSNVSANGANGGQTGDSNWCNYTYFMNWTLLQGQYSICAYTSIDGQGTAQPAGSLELNVTTNASDGKSYGLQITPASGSGRTYTPSQGASPWNIQFGILPNYLNTYSSTNGNGVGGLGPIGFLYGINGDNGGGGTYTPNGGQDEYVLNQNLDCFDYNPNLQPGGTLAVDRESCYIEIANSGILNGQQSSDGCVSPFSTSGGSVFPTGSGIQALPYCTSGSSGPPASLPCLLGGGSMANPVSNPDAVPNPAPTWVAPIYPNELNYGTGNYVACAYWYRDWFYPNYWQAYVCGPNQGNNPQLPGCNQNWGSHPSSSFGWTTTGGTQNCNNGNSPPNCNGGTNQLENGYGIGGGAGDFFFSVLASPFYASANIVCNNGVCKLGPSLQMGNASVTTQIQTQQSLGAFGDIIVAPPKIPVSSGSPPTITSVSSYGFNAYYVTGPNTINLYLDSFIFSPSVNYQNLCNQFYSKITTKYGGNDGNLPVGQYESFAPPNFPAGSQASGTGPYYACNPPQASDQSGQSSPYSTCSCQVFSSLNNGLGSGISIPLNYNCQVNGQTPTADSPSLPPGNYLYCGYYVGDGTWGHGEQFIGYAPFFVTQNPTSSSSQLNLGNAIVAPLFSYACGIYTLVNSVMLIIALIFMLIGALLYTGVNVLPTQSRGMVMGYAWGMLLGGIIGIGIAVLSTLILSLSTSVPVGNIIAVCSGGIV